MNIDRLAASNAASTYQVQNSPAAATSAIAPTSALRAGRHGHAAQGVDSVSLSEGARSLASARDAVQNSPDVRTQKVSDIKQQITDGTYSVSSRVLARKMLDSSANPA